MHAAFPDHTLYSSRPFLFFSGAEGVSIICLKHEQKGGRQTSEDSLKFVSKHFDEVNRV